MQESAQVVSHQPVLILSEGLDYHGIAVRWGLEQLGVTVTWWDRTSFPIQQIISSHIDDAKCTISARDPDPRNLTQLYRTIWNRRGQVPTVRPSLDPTDRTVAQNEANSFLSGLASILEASNPNALVVNPFGAAKSANPKVHQLAIARAVGFNVPRTLVSNDPSEIRAFYESSSRNVVAKQQIPFAWRTKSGALLVTGTSKLTEEFLGSGDALSACPMIYQEALNIESESRVIVFGRCHFALQQRRKHQPSAEGFLDIRYEDTVKRSEVVDPQLFDLCLAYMERLRLSYAAFDIAKTNDGRYVFLEANEAGQFLFLEDEHPDVPILDAFCQFLASGDPNFEYKSPAGLSLSSFEKTTEAAAFHTRYNKHMAESERTSPFELVE